MFCLVFVLAYPGILYAVYTGLYLMSSLVLSKKMLNATSDRYDFIVPLASLVGVLALILSMCDSAIHILISAFEWPIWFDLPIYLSLGIVIFISVSVGVTFYYVEIIMSQTWLKLRIGNNPTARHWMFGETRRIVNQGQRLPTSMLLGSILGESLLEEVLWRGYLLSYANDVLNMPVQYAIVISSVSFGMNHIAYGLANVLAKTLFGVILSLLYLASDSLLPCILCHQVFNLMVFKIRIEWKS